MVKILTYLRCVYKSNLESRRDEGPGDEDDDGKSNPVWMQRQTRCRLFKCDKMPPEEPNSPVNASIQRQNKEGKYEEAQRHALLPANTVNRQKDDQKPCHKRAKANTSTNKSTAPSVKNNTFVTSPSCGCVLQTPGQVTDEHELLSTRPN